MMMFDFNANTMAERISELENAKVSARRGAPQLVGDMRECFADDLRVLDLHTGKKVCAGAAEFLTYYQTIWAGNTDSGGGGGGGAAGAVAAGAGGRPKRVDLMKRVYMQRHDCKRASDTTTFALDFKRYARGSRGPDGADGAGGGAKAFWEYLGIDSSGPHQDVVFLYMALRNKVQVVYVAPDSDGLGTDDGLKLASDRFQQSAVFRDAKEFATHLSDSSMGDLDVHFNDYHHIEEVNFETIMAKTMAAGK